MKESDKKDLAQVLTKFAIIAALFFLAAHLEYLFNLSI